jgi:hypothetical protein
VVRALADLLRFAADDMILAEEPHAKIAKGSMLEPSL